MTPIEYPVWVWLSFFAVVFVALFVDIGIVNRKSHAPSRKETVIWSAVWVCLALLFGGFIFLQFGSFKSKEFLTGYLIELSLSIDNLFVFLLIFNFFKVPLKYQHRVLFWGIFMALVMRLVMIFAGVEIVDRFHWVLYLAGAFLVYTGVTMFREDEAFEPEESLLVKSATRFIRISKNYQGDRFLIIENGRRTGTLLLLVLIVINVADLVFAVDSIPAIFGITTDRFIVYTSNIFAILGLRTFYFLLADVAQRFHFLKYGLAAVLTFIGLKMLLPLLVTGLLLLTGESSMGAFADLLRRLQTNDDEIKQMVINISLAVVVLAIAASIVLSLIFPRSEEQEVEEGNRPDSGTNPA
ncbi:MAG: TerC family protein [bacterium]|nr:TerC family protein [bacterium]